MLLTLKQKPAVLVSLQSKDEFDILKAYDLMDSVIKVGELN